MEYLLGAEEGLGETVRTCGARAFVSSEFGRNLEELDSDLSFFQGRSSSIRRGGGQVSVAIGHP